MVPVTDNAVYLVCVVDGEGHFLTTADSDLRLLGDTYQDVPIVSWRELKDELAMRGLLV